MIFFVKKKANTQSTNTASKFSTCKQNFHLSAKNVQSFNPVNCMTRMAMTDLSMGLNVLEFLPTSFHVMRKTDFLQTGFHVTRIGFHEKQITSLQVQFSASIVFAIGFRVASTWFRDIEAFSFDIL